MCENQIIEFAQQNGFQSVQKLGMFNSYLVYLPVFTDNTKRYVGYPQYILVSDSNVQLKIDLDLEITNNFFKD